MLSAFSTVAVVVRCSAVWLAASAFLVTPSVGQEAAAASGAADELSCRAKSFADEGVSPEAAVWPKQSAGLPLNPACWVRAAQLLQEKSSASAVETTMLDVREPALRRTHALHGALPMDLADVQYKRFLQPNKIVLIGSGLDYLSLQRTCEGLVMQGFQDVRALQGGMPVWLGFSGGALGGADTGQSSNANGHKATAEQIQQSTAGEWIASLGQGIDWTVLSLSREFDASPAEQWPVGVRSVVHAGAAKNQLKDVFTELLEKAQASPLTASLARTPKALMVVADASSSAEMLAEINRLLGSYGNWPWELPVYWLRGGWAAYRAQVFQAQAISRTAAHKLQAPCGRI